MYYYSKSSKAKLEKCHPQLQDIAHALIQIMDVTILCGHRGEQAQSEAYVLGNTMLEYPHSKHNQTPSMAIDFAPWPIDWNDLSRFQMMCGAIEGIALVKGINIRLGRDFKMFVDMPHVELLESETVTL